MNKYMKKYLNYNNKEFEDITDNDLSLIKMIVY